MEDDNAHGDNTEKYITSATIRRTFGVAHSTLKSWANSGRVGCVRMHGGTGKRLYRHSDIVREFAGYHPRSEEGKEGQARRRAKIVYARVSSSKQKDDLERQIAALKVDRPNHEVVTDIGSGLNWKRPGLLGVLDRAMSGAVEEVVVAHRDRLCRFAFDLIKHVLEYAKCKLVVQYQNDDTAAPTDTELRDDLLAVVTCFVASNNGKRAAAHRRARQATTTAAEPPSSKRQKTTAADQTSKDEGGSEGEGGAGDESGGDEMPEAADLSDE